MEIYEFFSKYEFAEQESGASVCAGCECSVQECGQFPGCPLPYGYVFKKRSGKLPKYLSHE